MEFTKSEALTFGLELEFQIVNQATGKLSPSSLDLWKELSKRDDLERFSLEATLSTMEINSSVHTSADAMLEEVQGLAAHIREIAGATGLDIRGGGTQMTQFWNERIMAPTARAQELETKFGFLPKRFSTYGMHVHIGMPSGDDAIKVGNILQSLCPLFIAMSAASPFLQLADTGYAAARPLETLMYPHGGPMPQLRDWAHFEEITDEIFSTDLAKTLKDVYWDVRPKPEFGTVEIRVFDTPLSIKKAVAMASFSRACASLALSDRLQLSAQPLPPTAQRVSRFLACRDGMDAILFNPFVSQWMPAREWLQELLNTCTQQPDRAIPAEQFSLLRAILNDKQDHQIMRETWAEIQAVNLTPENLTDSLPQYSAKFCSLLAH